MTKLNESGDAEYCFYEPQPIEWPTLRDRFAMAALSGILAAGTDFYRSSDHRAVWGSDGSSDHRAVWAYAQADAMLKARREPS